MIKKKIILAAFVSTLMVTPAWSATAPLTNAPQAPRTLEKASNDTVSTDYRNTINKNNWVYKTLVDLNKKYNTNLEKNNQKFSMEEPLTRNEAAYLLINLVGKINKNDVKLNDYEKGRLDSVEEELQAEIADLRLAVNNLQSSVDKLNGRVTKVEKDSESTVKTGIGKDFKLTGSFQTRYAGNTQRGADNYANNFRIPVAELGFKGKLHDHVDVVANFQPGRYYDNPTAKTMMGDLYVSTDVLKHHTLYLGQTRTPVGYEGAQSTLTVDTVDKSQIARIYGDKRDIGLKIAGNYTYVDYYAGLYNGSRYMSQDNNNNMDTAVWVNFKPTAKFKKYGDIILGGGYATGDMTSSYDVLGGFVSYKYKKFGLRYELANSTGGTTSNGVLTCTDPTTGKVYKITDSLGNSVKYNTYNLAGVHSGGWYLLGTYDLTKKLQLVARMDQFDPNKDLGSNLIREYTLGTNYFIKGNNLKLQANFVLVDNQAAKDSQRLVIQTQYAF